MRYPRAHQLPRVYRVPLDYLQVITVDFTYPGTDLKLRCSTQGTVYFISDYVYRIMPLYIF
jgi:hypothetical protein